MRYLRFHRDVRGGLWVHPLEMGKQEIEEFLSYLAVARNVSRSTQNQAFSALLFLYRNVLDVELPMIEALRAAERRRLPVVLSRSEVRRLLRAIEQPVHRLMAELLYGSGLRLMECCRLRVKDVDSERGQIVVREGKGDKDRAVPLPEACRDRLRGQIDQALALHVCDLSEGNGEVKLPHAFARKSPNAGRLPGWQFVFPSSRLYRDPRGEEVGSECGGADARLARLTAFVQPSVRLEHRKQFVFVRHGFAADHASPRRAHHLFGTFDERRRRFHQHRGQFDQLANAVENQRTFGRDNGCRFRSRTSRLAWSRRPPARADGLRRR